MPRYRIRRRSRGALPVLEQLRVIRRGHRPDDEHDAADDATTRSSNKLRVHPSANRVNRRPVMGQPSGDEHNDADAGGTRPANRPATSNNNDDDAGYPSDDESCGPFGKRPSDDPLLDVDAASRRC